MGVVLQWVMVDGRFQGGKLGGLNEPFWEGGVVLFVPK